MFIKKLPDALKAVRAQTVLTDDNLTIKAKDLDHEYTDTLVLGNKFIALWNRIHGYEPTSEILQEFGFDLRRLKWLKKRAKKRSRIQRKQ
jgi:hypothetical protein